MLDKKNLIQLARVVAGAKPMASTAYSFNSGAGEEHFSYEELNETLRTEFNLLVGTNALYRENKNTLFTIMEEVIDDYLPQKVIDMYGSFAEIKTFPQGVKPIFTQRITQAAKRRAKQFVTKVGLAGIYEVFKLDGRSFELQTSAFGGAAQIGFEEFLDGRVNFADVLDIVMEGLDEAVYLEIERALKGSVSSLQAANKTSQNAFDEKEMDRLLQVADSYGGRATIYCTFEFAATMIPSEGWISDEMRNAKWNNGYLGNYKGHNVIVLPQSFEDETNSVKVIDPKYAWIIPTGADKPIKIAFEGGACVKERDNDDWSKDIHIYKKFGVAAVVTNNICVYVNKSLK